MQTANNQKGFFTIKFNLHPQNTQKWKLKQCIQILVHTTDGLQQNGQQQERLRIAVDNVHVFTFSPVIAKGALNHCSKVLQDLKIVGSKKFNSAHSSGRRF